MQELETLLQNHDWYYEYSDDMSAWRRGNDNFKKITSLMTSLGNTAEVKEIYNRYKI
jgi:hypothetical protein